MQAIKNSNSQSPIKKQTALRRTICDHYSLKIIPCATITIIVTRFYLVKINSIVIIAGNV